MSAGIAMVIRLSSLRTPARTRRARRSCSIGAVAIVVILLLAGCTTIPAARNGVVFNSPDGSRMAVIDDGAVVLDGVKQSRRYEEIYQQGVIFSSDASKIGYVGWRDGKAYVVVGQDEYGPYDNFGKDGIVFSPCGARFVALVARGGKWHVLQDGIESTPYDDILAGTPIFSRDSCHVAYAVRMGQRWQVMRDGVDVGDPVEGIELPGLAFSSEEKLIYATIASKQVVVHIDDWRSEPFDWIMKPGIFLSPDGNVGAYVGALGGSMVAGFNETLEPPYAFIGISFASRDPLGFYTKLFLADLALNLAAAPLGYRVIILPGSVPVDVATTSSVAFSPDSKHHGYFASDGTSYYLVLDGVNVKKLSGDADVRGVRFNASSQVLLCENSKDALVTAVPVASASQPLVAMEGGDSVGPTVDLSASQPDVLAFVDDAFAGVTPTKASLPDGVHRIRFEKRGFAVYEREVSVQGGQPTEIHAELEPSAVKMVLEKFATTDLLMSPNIPPAKLQAAKLGCGVPVSDPVLALIDATVGGSAKNALVFSESGLYACNAWNGTTPGAHFVSYTEFARTPAPAEHPAFEVMLTPKISFNTSASSYSKGKLIALLNELRVQLAQEGR